MKRSGYELLTVFGLILSSTWATYYFQFQSLPSPLTAEEAGELGFSEVEASKHDEFLSQLGPHSVGYDTLDFALEYIYAQAEKIKATAASDVEVEVQNFHVDMGANTELGGGPLSSGKTNTYADLNHVLIRILPKNNASLANDASEAAQNAILVSAHVDTVFAAPGAGDDSSNVAVMLEIARGISQQASGISNAVIFFFNTGEEEGLDGSHSFITQHPWSSTVGVAINLEAMGLGGKSGIFQAGPNSWAIDTFKSAAKYPSGYVTAQDLFASGIINSATDFQVYKEIGGLSGLDFAYTDEGAVYHTKNDKFALLKPGSLQQLGENMLPFLIQGASSSDFPKATSLKNDKITDDDEDTIVYYDILGNYMVVYKQSLASVIHYSVIAISLVIWVASLFMGGYPAVISWGLSLVSGLLMWVFSVLFAALVAVFLVPQISVSPVPYIAYPILVVGLFAAPAFLGALIGQYLGYLVLQNFLPSLSSKRKQISPFILDDDLVKYEAERWLFKFGFIQWLALLLVLTYLKVGSAYLALFWFVSPALAYGILEVSLTATQSSTPLKFATLITGMAVPVSVTAGVFIRLVYTAATYVVRLEKNPGSNSELLATVAIAIVIAAFICLTMVYFLSYVHLSGEKVLIILPAILLFGVSAIGVLTGMIPAFTEDAARALSVVHVVDTTGGLGENQVPNSYISLFSITPGKLTKEVEEIGEGFTCGTDKEVDFVTFSPKYSCWTYEDADSGWSDSDVPTLNVTSDIKGDQRITQVSIDTKNSTRFSLGINTDEIRDFILYADEEELIPLGNKTSADGWHIVQFAGGKNAPRKFMLTMYWEEGYEESARNVVGEDLSPLIKLRADLNQTTPKVASILEKYPAWCSLFGKSYMPHTLSFLTSLPVAFEAIEISSQKNGRVTTISSS